MDFMLGSFCNDSSCKYYRSHDNIYEAERISGSRNFFCFQPINW
jgi:hypothetical protein